MFLKPPMQTMPMSCACGRQGVSCKVKTAYKFYASFSELCMCFKHTPILYNLIKAHEGLQLSPLTPTQTGGWEFKAQPRARTLTGQGERKSLSKVAQDLVSWDMPPRPPAPQCGTPPTHSTKPGLGEVHIPLQGCLITHADDLGPLHSVEFPSLTLNSF